MSRIFLLFILLIAISPAVAYTMPFSISKTNDGFVIAGIAGEDYLKNSHAWVLKVDSSGNEVWNRTYYGECISHFHTIVRVDGGYLAGCFTGCGKPYPWLLKIDEDGNILWEKKFREFYGGVTAIAYSNGTAIAALTVNRCNGSSCQKYANTLILRIDSTGKETLTGKINYSAYDSIKMLKSVPDGFIGAGYIIDNGEYKIWVLKLDKAGKVEWSRLYDFGDVGMAWDVAYDGDGYLVAGEVGNNTWKKIEAIVFKINKSGNVVWKRTIDAGRYSSAWSISNNTIAGGVVDGGKAYIWFLENGSIVTIKNNFNLLSLVYGIVRMAKVQDGYVLAASGCNGNCLWLGKVASGKLVWEKTFGKNTSENTSVSEINSSVKSKSFTENTNEKIGEVGKSSTKNNSTKEVINVTEEKITSKKDKGEGELKSGRFALTLP